MTCKNGVAYDPAVLAVVLMLRNNDTGMQPRRLRAYTCSFVYATDGTPTAPTKPQRSNQWRVVNGAPYAFAGDIVQYLDDPPPEWMWIAHGGVVNSATMAVWRLAF